ncbi:armadillo-type protein [Emericellopsis atlantica]|uniref:Nucleolar protein 9 n=1 Tax=Emericellopsis atlantica TaxID=2614577 RepID=A0A9P7ZFK7_9HYPO|nr:armadillo-type protein [Emericellopsis atlantica]KAG9251213.1 armadillo-type protein [Emericellopsis atlantica]
MPKPRTKRGEERKRKRNDDQQAANASKRSRREDLDHDEPAHAHPEQVDLHGDSLHHEEAPETEFFGMLNEEEQEYFRHADELLELNQFPSPDDRGLFITSVFNEAKGKELKIASSQSCSRLMERLIQLADTAQKKQLFAAFAGHFLSLVQHRFASHCCEALFLRSAGAVSEDLGGDAVPFVVDTTKGGNGAEVSPAQSMESLFLETLDELEGSLAFLITDRFASHTLRVLLLVLSGRPLDDAAAKTLLKSKKKENVSVAGAAAADEANHGPRVVPASFTMAVQKIISDSMENVDATSLRVLAKHPIGNPTLQLLLELDLTLNKSEDHKPTLLFRLLPDAPKSLGDESSEASEFINGMVYDQIGSRLVETLITHAPGKVFKAMNQNIFLPRIQGYVRNDVSCYPAIRVLNRLGKDDLVKAVAQIEPTIPQLVSKTRYNVIRTLFERCVARGLNDEVKKLNKGLKEGCGPQPADLIRTLCLLQDEESEVDGKKNKKDATQLARNEYAIQSHGAQLLTTLFSIPGPAKGVQEALLALSGAQLLKLAQASMPAVTVLTTAFNTPCPNNPGFHKTLTSTLVLPHIGVLATSQYGHNILTTLVEVPSKGKERSVPFHMKEAVMDKLGQMEAELRNSWMGRSVWRSWKGDMWKTRRGDWKVWMREVDVPAQGTVSANKVAVKGRRENGRGKAVDEEPAAAEAVVEETVADETEPQENGDAMDVDGPEAAQEEPSEAVPLEDGESLEAKPKKDKKKKKKDKTGEDGDVKEKKSKKDKKAKKEKKEKKAKKEVVADEEEE